MVIIGGDERGFATVTGIGVEDDFELVLGIGVAGGRPITLSSLVYDNFENIIDLLRHQTLARYPLSVVSSAESAGVE